MKKSILARMVDADNRAGQDAEETLVVNPMAGLRRQSPVISNVGRALTHLTEDSIVTLDPNKIERSPFKDRFDNDAEADSAFEMLKNSIASEGQKIPVLVRKHPTKPEQYQLAYGYRRWVAISELNTEEGRGEPLKIKAYVRELTDRQLIEEQSLENGIRENLTWIEQAMFALQLKKVGYSQRAICPVLGLTEAAISHFGKVTGSIPTDIIYAIGRAKSVGRPKWTKLAEFLQDASSLGTARRLLRDPAFQQADSVKRFNQLFEALKPSEAGEREEELNDEEATAIANAWTSTDKSVSLNLNSDSRTARLEAKEPRAAEFGQWITANLDQLYEQFLMASKK